LLQWLAIRCIHRYSILARQVGVSGKPPMVELSGKMSLMASLSAHRLAQLLSQPLIPMLSMLAWVRQLFVTMSLMVTAYTNLPMVARPAHISALRIPGISLECVFIRKIPTWFMYLPCVSQMDRIRNVGCINPVMA